MIIKGERVSTSRALAPLIRHLLHGDENDEITLLQGTAADIRSAFTDARYLDRKYSVRHFIISPAVETSDDDAKMVLELLGKEYVFNPTDAVFIKHLKPRAVEGAFGGHWHALIREQDPATGRTLSSKFNYLRNQKISCIAAHRLGHPMVALPHEAAVLNALESDGLIEVMSAVRAASDERIQIRPREGFSTDAHQMGKRRGADIPAARAAVRAAWETTFDRVTLESALAKSQLRIRLGEKPDTFIVETLDGVFCGAAHRLARVRRIDFHSLMQGEQNVRDHQSITEQRQGVSPTAPLGNSKHQGAPKSTGPARKRDTVAARGSGSKVAGVNLDGNTRPTDESRSDSPTPRRHSSLRSRCCTRRFRKTMNRKPERLQKLLATATFLAQSPVERVAYRLARYEEHLEGQLKSLLSRPPSPALAALQRTAANLRVRIDKYDDAIAAAQAHVRTVTASEPTGLRSRMDGARHRWKKRLSVAEKRCTALTDKLASIWERWRRNQGAIAELEKSETRAHSQALRSAELVGRVSQLRHQIEHVTTSRARLNICPALAWGGVVMVLGVMTAIEAAESMIEHESGPSSLPVGATDIWGVGLRNELM